MSHTATPDPRSGTTKASSRPWTSATSTPSGSEPLTSLRVSSIWPKSAMRWSKSAPPCDRLEDREVALARAGVGVRVDVVVLALVGDDDRVAGPGPAQAVGLGLGLECLRVVEEDGAAVGAVAEDRAVRRGKDACVAGGEVRDHDRALLLQRNRGDPGGVDVDELRLRVVRLLVHVRFERRHGDDRRGPVDRVGSRKVEVRKLPVGGRVKLVLDRAGAAQPVGAHGDRVDPLADVERRDERRRGRRQQVVDPHLVAAGDDAVLDRHEQEAVVAEHDGGDLVVGAAGHDRRDLDRRIEVRARDVEDRDLPVRRRRRDRVVRRREQVAVRRGFHDLTDGAGGLRREAAEQREVGGRGRGGGGGSQGQTGERETTTEHGHSSSHGTAASRA